MRIFENLGKRKFVIGLVHLLPLPGTRFYEEGNVEKALDKAVADATALYQGGAQGCLVQTVDRIYPVGEEVDYARMAAMSTIVQAVSEATGPEFQIGVQILWNALKASLAVAKVCGGSFLRCNAFVGATMTPSGVAQSDPVGFQKYRAQLGTQDIKLIAEVDGTHFRWMGGKPTAEVARLALAAGAHAVEVAHPDEETNMRMVRDVKEAMPDLPVILGGHTNHENVARRLAAADGVFVGSCFETDGWGSCVDREQVQRYMDIVSELR
jgi:membrane complex biogenesis BtpA family protein